MLIMRAAQPTHLACHFDHQNQTAILKTPSETSILSITLGCAALTERGALKTLVGNGCLSSDSLVA